MSLIKLSNFYQIFIKSYRLSETKKLGNRSFLKEPVFQVGICANFGMFGHSSHFDVTMINLDIPLMLIDQ